MRTWLRAIWASRHSGQPYHPARHHAVAQGLTWAAHA